MCVELDVLFCILCVCYFCFFFKQKTAYEMRISDWSSDVCSSDLRLRHVHVARGQDVPQAALPVSYGLLLNLVGVMGADASKEQIWRYLGQYVEIGRASCRERVCQYV